MKNRLTVAAWVFDYSILAQDYLTISEVQIYGGKAE